MKIVLINVVASRKHRPPGMPIARANPFLILHNRNQKLAAISVIQVGKHMKASYVETFCIAASLSPPFLSNHFVITLDTININMFLKKLFYHFRVD